MLEVKFIDEFKRMASVNRKISRDDGLAESIDYIFKSIDYFNSFDEYHHVIEDVHFTEFKDIPILNEFKDFILPRSIRYEPVNLRTKDVLVRPKSPDKFKFDISKYHIEIDNFRRYFKKDAKSEFVTLEDLKKHISLSEAIDRMFITVESDKYVKSGANAFIPIELSTDLSNILDDSYFDTNYDKCVFDYMHKLIF